MGDVPDPTVSTDSSTHPSAQVNPAIRGVT
jgi:hypothetical protein